MKKYVALELKIFILENGDIITKSDGDFLDSLNDNDVNNENEFIPFTL